MTHDELVSALREAGWETIRVTPPIGLSGAMYPAEADDQLAVQVWWEPRAGDLS